MTQKEKLNDIVTVLQYMRKNKSAYADDLAKLKLYNPCVIEEMADIGLLKRWSGQSGNSIGC